MAEICPTDLAAQCDAPDHSCRHVVASMIGVYVAINAIRDAYLLVDGPDCVFMKTQYLQGNHDYMATLTSVSGHHRISHSALRVSHQGALSREEELTALLEKIARNGEAGGVLLTPMPVAQILGIDYDRLCRDAQTATGKEITYVRCRSLSTDWLGGYAETLLALARGIDLGRAEPAAGNVAVVGHLFDRNEEDSLGNVRELRRLLDALGLKLVSIWPSGERLDNLREVRRAQKIVALPYGRDAAAALGKRLGIEVIQTELPFGLQATERWLRDVASAFGVPDSAEALIAQSLARVVPRLEWVVPFLFEGRGFGYVGDPFLFPGFVETIGLLGGETRFAVITNFGDHLDGVELAHPVEHVLVEQRSDSLGEWLKATIGENDLACVVTNNACLEMMQPSRHAVVEFGFPSHAAHALYDRPSLGFGGFLAFVDTLANQMRLFQSLPRR